MWSASMWSWCIFQFPLTSGRRPATSGVRSGRGAAPRVRAGRRPRSMKASDAPPPVERKSTWSQRPSSSRALALSPPPTTEKPVARRPPPGPPPACRRRIERPRRRPAGPFHSTVPAWLHHVGEGGGRLGPDVEPGPAVGQVALDDLDPAPRPIAARTSRRARAPGCRSAGGCRVPSRAGRGSPQCGRDRTGSCPTRWPCAARKVKAMPPPTISVSTLGASALSTSILSATLAPPTTATNGRAGHSRMPPSTSTSRARRRPAALGRNCGGPTMEA